MQLPTRGLSNPNIPLLFLFASPIQGGIFPLASPAQESFYFLFVSPIQGGIFSFSLPCARGGVSIADGGVANTTIPIIRKVRALYKNSRTLLCKYSSATPQNSTTKERRKRPHIFMCPGAEHSTAAEVCTYKFSKYIFHISASFQPFLRFTPF